MDVKNDRLAEDLASAAFGHGVGQGFWEFVAREQDTVFVLLHAPDGRDFLARMDCSDYWTEPIGCLFVDPKDRQVRLEAWPDGNGVFESWVKFRGNPYFICWDQDRIGIQHHQDRKATKAWQKKPNQIVAYLEFLTGLFHVRANGYTRQKCRPAA